MKPKNKAVKPVKGWAVITNNEIPNLDSGRGLAIFGNRQAAIREGRQIPVTTKVIPVLITPLK